MGPEVSHLKTVWHHADKWREFKQVSSVIIFFLKEILLLYRIVTQMFSVEMALAYVLIHRSDPKIFSGNLHFIKCDRFFLGIISFFLLDISNFNC